MSGQLVSPQLKSRHEGHPGGCEHTHTLCLPGPLVVAKYRKISASKGVSKGHAFMLEQAPY
jgi:hypothetical protein